MIASVAELRKIENIDSYDISFNKRDPAVSSIFSISSGSIKKSFLVTNEYLDKLAQSDVLTVSINTDRDNLAIVEKCAVNKFKKEKAENSFKDLYAITDEYELMNKISQRKRQIHILEDLLSREVNLVTGDQDLLFEYGAELDPALKEKIKSLVLPAQPVYYANSEEGILVFITNPQDIKVKIFLRSILADLPIKTFDAKDAIEAMEIYKKEQPRLVILGRPKTDLGAKEFLIELDKYDPFAKKIDFDNSTASEAITETVRIKDTYYSGYINEIKSYRPEKEPLAPEISKKLNLVIHKLQDNYSRNAFIETAFTIHQLSKTYNVTFLTQLLESIKKRHTV